MIERVIDGVVGPERTWTYEPVPFDVPDGIGRIEVSYDYDAAISSDPTVTGGNVVDLGVFDQRGAEFLGKGFRGWSGSERKTFTISADSATPGYLAGPILAGTWNVILGLYKIAPQGCHYRVTVRLYEGAGAGEFPATLPVRSESPRPANASGWYKGELHCHSIHSDGKNTVEEIVAAAQALGLDFLAITDHNTVSQQVALRSLDTDLILIPGYEVTSYNGHWNFWGSGEWIDFRTTKEVEMAAAVEAACHAGYLVSLNHPRPYGPDWMYPNVVASDSIEVWNGPWEYLNDVCLGFWERRLNAGRRFVAVGGSDCHNIREANGAKLAQPTTYIYCKGAPSAAKLLDGLRAGHTFVTNGPTGPQLYLSSGDAMMGDAVPRPEAGNLPLSLRVVGGADAELEIHTSSGHAARRVVIDADASFALDVDVSATPYVRAQLRDPQSGALLAVSNPIYLD
jgi:hypothetical protein